MLATRVIIAHSVLLVLAPFAQSATGIPGGWTDATLLVILFIAGPVGGLFLRRSGQDRTGTVLLLAFMSAATYMHVEMMLTFMNGQGPEAVISAAGIGLQVLLVLLILTSLFGSLLSFALLRSIHDHSAPTERDHFS